MSYGVRTIILICVPATQLLWFPHFRMFYCLKMEIKGKWLILSLCEIESLLGVTILYKVCRYNFSDIFYLFWEKSTFLLTCFLRKFNAVFSFSQPLLSLLLFPLPDPSHKMSLPFPTTLESITFTISESAYHTKLNLSQ